ncbi:MAG: HAD family hydrolase [Candidatus Omnitrophica bacterium]|nr:HAD family hydrolase [Candidatus Omnitrophota bacterium]
MNIVFLDRDGVINKFPGKGQYVTSPGGFSFLPGSIEAIKKLNDNDFKVYVVSNQAGVAKGLYSQKDLDAIDRKMTEGLKKKKAHVDGIYYCTHSSDEKCSCRKPATGLLQKAMEGYKGNSGCVFFIGDSMVDIETAKNQNINSILVLSGRVKLSEQDTWRMRPDYVFDNLLLAAYYLCNHYGK